MYVAIERQTVTSVGAVEGPRARAEEGHGRARWRPHEEEEGGGVTEDDWTATRGRSGWQCHGLRRTDGGARKKRATVFDEEEEERIDLRQALAVIYQRDLLPVPATSRE